MTVRPADDPPFERTLKIVVGQDTVPANKFADLAVGFAAGCSDTACCEALALAASELADNIVKYGMDHSDPRSGTIFISFHGNVIRLCATNAVAASEDAGNVTDIAHRLSLHSTNAAVLYRTRMGELFANPDLPRTGLGLLRLAVEGGFRLSASFEDPLLQIVAERRCRGH